MSPRDVVMLAFVGAVAAVLAGKGYGRGHRIASPWQRRVVVLLDWRTCVLCRRIVWLSDIDIDHLRPWSKGGRTIVGNLGCAHKRCNLRKGAKTVGGLMWRVNVSRVVRWSVVAVVFFGVSALG